jgi:hypothetical protein
LSPTFFFSSRTTARCSSSSLSSLLLYRYVLLMRMLSFSISLSQLLSPSSRFPSVYIPHPRFLSCLACMLVLSNSQVCSCSFAESLSTFPS